MLLKYRPVPKLNRRRTVEIYDALGDGGILRTFLCGKQGGCWQDACELFGVENLILATFDDPDWVCLLYTSRPLALLSGDRGRGLSVKRRSCLYGDRPLHPGMAGSSPGAVSYPHLDVYKRQWWIRPQPPPANPWSTPLKITLPAPTWPTTHS